MNKELYVITSGIYKGRKGYVDASISKKTGNVMFYTVEGKHPYRVCKDKNEVEVYNE